jgi:hypothetical protein
MRRELKVDRLCDIVYFEGPTKASLSRVEQFAKMYGGELEEAVKHTTIHPPGVLKTRWVGALFCSTDEDAREFVARFNSAQKKEV